jgi:DnaK suppressor protein
MASMAHRARDADRARQDRLEQLLGQQDAILRNRKQILRDGLPTATSGVMDFEELSLDAEEQGVGFSVLELTSRAVQGIETALQRLEAGGFGRCCDCRCTISGARLRALPFAALCLTCQENHDVATGWSKGVASTRNGLVAR